MVLGSTKHFVSIIWLGLVLGLLVSCGSSETLFQSQSKKAVRHGVYVVQKGDSLYSIAWRFRRDYKELAKINGIKSPYIIKVGQEIKLASYQDEIPSKSGFTGQTIIDKPQSTYQPKSSSTKKRKSKPAPNPRKKGNQKRFSFSKNKIKWAWPAKGKVIQGFSSSSVGKKGIQIAGNAGDPVLASADGQVVYSGNSLVGYGNLVIVKHSETFLTAYAHNRRVSVKEGDVVSKGQKIAEVGASGTDRNKLHFEIRKEGKPVNPLWYLPRRR